MVLVVDDDAEIRQALTDVLEDEQYEVLTASNGREALQLVGDGLVPDVILLDVMMPVMDGIAFRAALARDAGLAAIPIIVISAYCDLEDTARELGAAGHLAKPLQLRELLSTVERVLG